MEQCAGTPFGRDDSLVKVAPLLAMVHDWQAFLDSPRPEGEVEELRKHTRTGRPLGDEAFLDRLEGLAERDLKPKRAGRPKKIENHYCVPRFPDFESFRTAVSVKCQRAVRWGSRRWSQRSLRT